MLIQKDSRPCMTRVRTVVGIVRASSRREFGSVGNKLAKACSFVMESNRCGAWRLLLICILWTDWLEATKWSGWG